MIITIAGAVPAGRDCQAAVISLNFDLPIPSPDDPCSGSGRGRMADANLDITEHISIIDLDIAVSLTHESFYDLEISLKSPTGITIILNPSLNSAFLISDSNGYHSIVGGSNRFWFDDEAAVGIENATSPFDRAFKPVDGLSAFNGKDAFGQWRVQIQDIGDAHTGRLERVELIIASPEPSSVCLLGLLAIMAIPLKPRKAVRFS
jgi:subtilisin-like proprotein convertase family protein